jgi:DNA primase catalytic core
LTVSTEVGPRLVEAHREAIDFYRRQLLERQRGWAYQHVIARRAAHVLLKDSVWKVGYAPETWSGLVNHLRRLGFQDDELLRAGLATTSRTGYLLDRFRDRLMFPIHDVARQPVAFIGRARAGHHKYLNTSATVIYRKSEGLVGLDEQKDALDANAVPVIVEGPADALAINTANADGPRRWAGIAVCGTAVGYGQAAALQYHARSKAVMVAFDGDLAGKAAAVRSLELLSSMFPRVLVAELPSGHDPSSLLCAPNGLARLRTALTSPRLLADVAIEQELDRWSPVLDHISGQVNAVRAVAPIVARLPPTRVAGEVARLARMLGLDEEIISRELVAAVGRPLRRAPSRRALEPSHGAGPPLPEL